MKVIAAQWAYAWEAVTGMKMQRVRQALPWGRRA